MPTTIEERLIYSLKAFALNINPDLNPLNLHYDAQSLAQDIIASIEDIQQQQIANKPTSFLNQKLDASQSPKSTG